MVSPTPTQIRDALGDFGVPAKLCSGWNSRGGGWPSGLKATVTHHTSTASATGSVGAPSLEWCLTAFSRPAANMLIGRSKNDIYLMNAEWTYHTGNGGPAPKYGAAAGNTFHKMAWGIEIDDPGRRVGSLTDDQIEFTGRTLAAIQSVARLSNDDHYTHTCWTNLCHGMSNSHAPYYGRKDDTLGDSGGKSGAYSAIFWRHQAGLYVPGSIVPVGEDNDMPIIIVYGRSSYLLDGGRLSEGPLSDVSLNNLKAAGVKSVGIDAADWVDLAPYRAEWAANKSASV